MSDLRLVIPDVIELRAIRATGTHGLLDEEKRRAQPFEIDIDLHLDLRAAGASDRLDDTVDYGAVAAAVVQTVSGPHVDLLERLAELIARAAAAAAVTPGGRSVVEGVTVAVRKVRPPVPADMQTAGVRIHRRRQDLG